MIRFSKPKTPGFGLSQNFYMTVLAARATLPTVEQVIHPMAEGGAVEGFGVPLSKSATKEDLHRPLQRGAYALSSKDRKTVLRCLVLSKEEAGFDPETFAESSLAATASSEMLARIRGTWSLIQLCFESHDPMVAPALNFLVELVRRFGELSDGVIADPISKRYLLPSELPILIELKGISAATHVAVHFRPENSLVRCYTLGMQKFALNEIEIADVPDTLCGTAEAFLLSLCQAELNGSIPRLNDSVGGESAPFQVCDGGLDKSLWDGIPCFELVPPRNGSVETSLRAWE
jgi:hypothetical protein